MANQVDTLSRSLKGFWRVFIRTLAGLRNRLRKGEGVGVGVGECG